MNELSSLLDRVSYLKRAYARGLGHKPTTLQSAAIQRAAVLSAKAEAAALDPNTSANDLVRLDHAAARARRDMEHALQRVKPRGQNLDEYVASTYGAGA